MAHAQHTGAQDSTRQTLTTGQGATRDAIGFTVHNRTFQMLLSPGVEGPPGAVDNDKNDAVVMTRYANADIALREMSQPDDWLLVLAQTPASLSYRKSLLTLPERHWTLLRAEHVGAGGFRDFRGTVALMSEVSMSPQDLKLFGRQTDAVMTRAAGWGRVLGAYLKSLDVSTLCVLGKEEFGWAMLEQQLMALLRRTLLERAHSVSAQPNRPGMGSRSLYRGEPLFQRICDWIKDNYTNLEMSSEFVADHFDVSARYIQTLFSKYGDGSTFVSLLRETRLQRARDMLNNSEYDDKNISEICWNCGFSDPVYFGKAFREFFGMTPGEARRRSGLQDEK